MIKKDRASDKTPTAFQIQASRDKTVPDILAPGLKVVFCGINPGLYSAAVGYHFARPGNRFWKALFESGFTDRQLDPCEQSKLIDYGCGLTNLVQRATAAAAELSADELTRGRDSLAGKVHLYRPLFVGMLGLSAFRTAFGVKNASIGIQDSMLEGAKVWVLPNPSGLNAHFKPDDFARLFSHLKSEAFE